MENKFLKSILESIENELEPVLEYDGKSYTIPMYEIYSDYSRIIKNRKSDIKIGDLITVRDINRDFKQLEWYSMVAKILTIYYSTENDNRKVLGLKIRILQSENGVFKKDEIIDGWISGRVHFNEWAKLIEINDEYRDKVHNDALNKAEAKLIKVKENIEANKCMQERLELDRIEWSEVLSIIKKDNDNKFNKYD